MWKKPGTGQLWKSNDFYYGVIGEGAVAFLKIAAPNPIIKELSQSSFNSRYILFSSLHGRHLAIANKVICDKCDNWLSAQKTQ